MSNVQTSETKTRSQFFTPIILQHKQEEPQLETTLEFIKEHFSWELKPNSAELTIINQDLDSISIKEIRNLIGELSFASRMGKKRAILLLSADQLSLPAQHAFLKSLEEPPKKTLLVLATTSPQELLTTIASRCQLYQTSPKTQNQGSNKEEKAQKNHLPELLIQLTQDPNKITYSQIIDLVAEYKSRDEAMQLTTQFLFWLQLKTPKKPQTIKLQQLLLEGLNQLKGNVNPRLVLEDCFFSAK